jgi:hypothetical protein
VESQCAARILPGAHFFAAASLTKGYEMGYQLRLGMERPMDLATKLYAMLRATRWASWLFYLLYCIYFLSDRKPHLDQFGHLILSTELALYGIPVFAIFVGFLEMMTRERAGLAKPTFGHLMPKKAPQTNVNHFAGR